MREELSLLAVILIIFLADLFMSKEPKDGEAPAGSRIGLISCILLIMAYSVLKKSPAMAALSANTESGFSTLFTAEILVIMIFIWVILYGHQPKLKN